MLTRADYVAHAHHPGDPDYLAQYVPLEHTSIQLPEEIVDNDHLWSHLLLLLDEAGLVLGFVTKFNSRTMEYTQQDIYPNEDDPIRSIQGKAAKVLIRKAYAADPAAYERNRVAKLAEIFGEEVP